MVILEKVIKRNNIIEADYYYPEAENDKGHIVFDIKNAMYTNIDYCEDDKNSLSKYRFGKVIEALKRMVQYDKYPETYHYYWY